MNEIIITIEKKEMSGSIVSIVTIDGHPVGEYPDIVHADGENSKFSDYETAFVAVRDLLRSLKF